MVVTNDKLIANAHLDEWVKGSGIKESLARLALNSIDNPDAIAKLLNWKFYKGSPGWYTISIDPITGMYRQSGQFKPDEPITFPDSDKPQKYFTFPKGKESLIFFPAVDMETWEAVSEFNKVPILLSDIDQTRDDLGFYKWVINHPELLLVPTEGIKKGYTLLSLGYIPLILPGVWNGQKKKKLHPDLVPFIVPGRPLTTTFDSDILIKENVQAALKVFCTLAQKAKAEVKVAEWDVALGKGIDDVVVQNEDGVNSLHAIMDNATPYTEWAKRLEAQFGDGGTNETEKKKPKPPSARDTAAKLASKYRNKLAWSIPIRAWMRYDDLTGIWGVEHIVTIQGVVKAELDCIPSLVDAGYSFHYLKEVINFLCCELAVKKWNEQPGLIPLTDGVLEVATMRKLPHAPGYRLTWQLPYAWKDRSIGCQPIQDWLLEAMKGDLDTTQLLRAFLKAVVLGRTDLHIFLEAIGPGGTGKSTFMKLAEALIGEVNTYITTLKQLEQNRFEGAAIFGKRLLLITDSERYGGEVSTLKAITGGDGIRYEKKNVQQGEGQNNKFKPNCMVMVAANEMIQSSDYTSGLERRRCTIPFVHQVEPSKRRDLDKEFQPYLPGLLKWVLDMPDSDMEKLLKDTATSVKSLRSWKAETLLDTNPIAEWFDFHVVLDTSAKTYVGVAKKDKAHDSENQYLFIDKWLYASYAERSASTGAKAVSLRRFSGSLHDLCVSQLKLKGVDKGRDEKGAYFQGLVIRNDSHIGYPRPITGKEFPPDDDPNGGGGGNQPINPKPPTNPDGLTANPDGKITNPDGFLTAESIENDGSDGYEGFSITQDQTVENEGVKNTEDLAVRTDVVENPSTSSVTATIHQFQGFEPSAQSVSIHQSPSASIKGTPYPGRVALNQTKEPKQIAEKLRAIKTKEDHQQVLNEYQHQRDCVRWVWVNLLTDAERQQLEPIIKGEIVQLDLSAIATDETRKCAEVLGVTESVEGLHSVVKQYGRNICTEAVKLLDEKQSCVVKVVKKLQIQLKKQLGDRYQDLPA